MHGETSEIHHSLRQKVEQLVAAYEQLQREHQQLQTQYAELQQQLASKGQALSELNGRFTALNLAQAIKGSSSDMHDARIKVNRIVREIDKCIALLNK